MRDITAGWLIENGWSENKRNDDRGGFFYKSGFIIWRLTDKAMGPHWCICRSIEAYGKLVRYIEEIEILKL